jgi:hypothetical protein
MDLAALVLGVLFLLSGVDYKLSQINREKSGDI